MRSSKYPQLGLLLFAIVFAVSLGIVLAGSINPVHRSAIAVGDRVTECTLTDELTGASYALTRPGQGNVLLVYTPADGLSKAQCDSVYRVYDSLAQSMPIETIAVGRDSRSIDRQIRAISSMVLLDADDNLPILTGGDRSSAAICLLDADRQLRFRTVITEQPTDSEIAKTIGLAHHALASIGSLALDR